MICPKCGSEYEKSFTECADCKISLVSDSQYAELKNKNESDVVPEIDLNAEPYHPEGLGSAGSYDPVEASIQGAQIYQKGLDQTFQKKSLILKIGFLLLGLPLFYYGMVFGLCSFANLISDKFNEELTTSFVLDVLSFLLGFYLIKNSLKDLSLSKKSGIWVVLIIIFFAILGGLAYIGNKLKQEHIEQQKEDGIYEQEMKIEKEVNEREMNVIKNFPCVSCGKKIDPTYMKYEKTDKGYIFFECNQKK
jgi:hypothetical protein